MILKLHQQKYTSKRTKCNKITRFKSGIKLGIESIKTNLVEELGLEKSSINSLEKCNLKIN